MNDHQTVGEAWDWVRHQPRAGDVFRSKLGHGRDEVELLCFDPLGRDGLGAWRVGYGEHDVISHAALVDLYYPVSRGPDATPRGDLVAFARWWIHNTKIVNTTEAIAACITRVVYGGRDDEKNRQAYAQVRHAIEAIAAYEQARGIKADYSRSDHMHDAGQSGTSNSAPRADHAIAKPAVQVAPPDEVKGSRCIDDEPAALRIATTEALPEWAKPGQKVRRFGDRPQPRPDPDMVVIAADHGRILIGERSPFGRVPPFVVCAPDFGGWWPVDDKGNPLGAEPRKVTTSAEVDAGMAARGVSTKSADIGLAKEAVAELCNEYLRHGERSSGGVARSGDKVSVPEAKSADARRTKILEWLTTAKLNELEAALGRAGKADGSSDGKAASIAAIDRMVAECPDMGDLQQRILEQWRGLIREEFDAVGDDRRSADTEAGNAALDELAELGTWTGVKLDDPDAALGRASQTQPAASHGDTAQAVIITRGVKHYDGRVMFEPMDRVKVIARDYGVAGQKWMVCLSPDGKRACSVPAEFIMTPEDAALQKHEAGYLMYDSTRGLFGAAVAPAERSALAKAKASTSRAFLEADIATLDAMLSRDGLDHIARMSFEARRAQAKEELDALMAKPAAVKAVGDDLVVTRGIKHHNHEVVIAPFANVIVHSTMVVNGIEWRAVSAAGCPESIVVPAVYVMTARESMRQEHSAEYLVLHDGVAQEPGNGLSHETIQTIKALCSRAPRRSPHQGPQ